MQLRLKALLIRHRHTIIEFTKSPDFHTYPLDGIEINS